MQKLEYSISQKKKHMISLKCSARVRGVQQLIERSQIAPSGLKGRNYLTRGLPKRGVVLNASYPLRHAKAGQQPL